MKSNSSSGVGVLGLLGVAFVVLKLTGYIDWSWWFVTMPFWITIPIVLFIILITFIFSAIKYYKIKKKYDKFRSNR